MLMHSSYSIEFDVYSDSSDTSCGVYLKTAFMTIFTMHPEATIRERLLLRPRLLTDNLRYMHLTYIHI